jgi:tetratricopeptide (TPR) repeat protein
MSPDYEAMRWLEENLEGTPIVLQAAWEFYRANGVRVAWNTGYPTVLNPLHADEQRYPAQKVEREQDVFRFYNEADPAGVLPLLGKYHIGYVYIGPFERAAYSMEGIAKFEALVGSALNLVYDNGEVQIYQVAEDARTAGGVSASAPMAIPTVSPMAMEQRTESELERLRAMADANPSDAGLQFDLGNRLRQAGRLEEAAEVFERSLTYHPEDVAMYQTLGDTFQEMGRMDDALTQYEAAAEAAPDNPAVHNKLGMAFRDRARYEEAVAAFQQAIRADAGFVEAYFHLGETLELAGDRRAAGDAYQQLVEINPQSDWATRAAERLRALAAGAE